MFTFISTLMNILGEIERASHKLETILLKTCFFIYLYLFLVFDTEQFIYLSMFCTKPSKSLFPKFSANLFS